MLKKDSVSLPEMALGYFLGPFGVLIVNAVFTCFLNRFYTDALGLSGKFITALPLVCTIFVTIANIILGILIDRTRTKMGKARPYLLIAAPLMVPVVGGLGYDLIQFGIVMTIGIQVGQLTPPVGINLFQVAGMQKESVASVIRGAVPFLLLLMAVWVLVIFCPGLTAVATTLFT